MSVITIKGNTAEETKDPITETLEAQLKKVYKEIIEAINDKYLKKIEALQREREDEITKLNNQLEEHLTRLILN